MFTDESIDARRIGICIVGLGGAVATTAVAGMAMLRHDEIGVEGLPLATLPRELTCSLASYQNLVFGGWDVNPDDLARAAKTHNVLSALQLDAVAGELENIKPFPAIGSLEFCRNIECTNVVAAESHRDGIEFIRTDISGFKASNDLDTVVVINLASTERSVDLTSSVYSSIDNFERALDDDSSEISPAMLYAYAAIKEGCPYGNFTPSVAADVPALIELALREGVPLAGKDGKTGQTFIKTVIAPALRARALHVEGWFSTNILGNRDGLALNDKDSLASKLGTKGSVLDQILGYKVEDHLVDIRYYKPRGDNKEAWDNIDVTGFMGQPMQIKINFLCKDSILAAPLVIEIARLLDLAQRRRCYGAQEQFGVFFKLPMTATPERLPEHAFHVQEKTLYDWLAADAAIINTEQSTLSTLDEENAFSDERPIPREHALAMEAGD